MPDATHSRRDVPSSISALTAAGVRFAGRRRTIVWCAALLFALHNAEEAVAFRYFLPRTPAVLPEPAATLAARLSYSSLLIALAVVSVLGLLVALAADRYPQSSRALWAVLVLEATVGLNALAHLGTALALFRGYGPGVITAAFVNAPFAVYCFRRAARERWVSPTALRATLPAALVLHGPVLLGGLWLASVAGR